VAPSTPLRGGAPWSWLLLVACVGAAAALTWRRRQQ
jgi:hypothetical protein